jgi:hypothetical protein
MLSDYRLIIEIGWGGVYVGVSVFYVVVWGAMFFKMVAIGRL